MAVEDKVDFLISQVDHLQNITLVAEAASLVAFVCTVVALVYTKRALKAINEPPPPLPKEVRLPPPETASEHPCDLDELAKYKPKSQSSNHDVLAGLAKELKI